jgi:outer membrane protein TolC
MTKYLIQILLVICCGSAYSQTTIKISLGEAVELALKNKPSLKRAALDGTIAIQNLEESKRKYIPDITSEFTVQYNPIIPTSIIPIGQFNPQNPTLDTRAVKFGLPWSNTAGINARQAIFDPSLQNEIKERKIELELAELNRLSEQNLLTYNVMKSYFGVLLAQEEIKFAKSDTIRAYQLLKVAENRFEGDQSNISEKNQAAYNLEKARYNFINITSNLELAINEFCFATGLPQQTAVELTTGFELIFPSNNTDLLDSASLIQRVDFKKAVYQSALNEQKIKSERAKLLPVLAFNGFIGANQFTQQINFNEQNSWFGNSFLNLNLQLPITGYFTKAKKIEQYQSQKEQNKYQLEELREQYEFDSRTVSIKLKALQKLYELQISELNLSQVNFELAKSQFTEGQVLATEMYTQETNLQQSQYKLIMVMYDMMIQNLEMQKINGFANSTY